MSIEAMKLALDCLEDIFGKEKIDVGAINALRQAIAEAERQESDDLTIAYMSGFHDGKNKYAPQRKPLTDEEFSNLVVENLGPHALTGGKMSVYDAFLIAVRATEAAHGIKE